jgi:hypothetical protein
MLNWSFVTRHPGRCRIFQPVCHAKNRRPLTKKLDFGQNFVEFVEFFPRIVELEIRVMRHPPCRFDCTPTDLLRAKIFTDLKVGTHVGILLLII